jgi:hypothetical protein
MRILEPGGPLCVTPREARNSSSVRSQTLKKLEKCIMSAASVSLQ